MGRKGQSGHASLSEKLGCVWIGGREKEVPDCTLLEKRSQTVLDSLVRTILSQNTTDTLSKRAFDSLKVSPGRLSTWTYPCVYVSLDRQSTCMIYSETHHIGWSRAGPVDLLPASCLSSPLSLALSLPQASSPRLGPTLIELTRWLIPYTPCPFPNPPGRLPHLPLGSVCGTGGCGGECQDRRAGRDQSGTH